MSDDRIATQATCRRCGAAFRPNPRAKGTFCSRRCWYDHLKASKPTTICERCGTPFRMKPAKLKQGRGKYCSRTCSVPALAEARTRDLAERFREKVRKAPDGGCWEWTGSKDVNGYGRIMVKRDDGQYIPILAHRLSWKLSRGPIPEGQGVLHYCDTPACVRPDHLFLGDARANAQDAASKDRTTFGERNPMAKLTEEQAIEIARRCQAGENQYRIASDYGVCQAVVSKIVRGESWRRATGIEPRSD
jgi:hypothetical protein